MSEGTLGKPDNKARVRALKLDGKSVKEIMEITTLKKPTVYAYLRPDQAKTVAKAKPVARKGVSVDAPASLTVTPTNNGAFMVRVPADKLAAVAKTLAG